uniref:Uncharacterized protein n=1 Tax=Entomoneis paludosa TaxID=265537 RepID=A0A7S3DVM2_9STRA|mmetsp:Transcript_41034/g.85426  ORF Transcript_41034/g.85426 Transcript_41034/m.85426 type:complete len:135 (+) Transcript_41034:238-642(+)
MRQRYIAYYIRAGHTQPLGDWTKPFYWNRTSRQQEPTPWTCISDSLYRHSVQFSQHLHEQILRGIYRFAEGFQQPMALHGNFSIADLNHLLTLEEGGPSGFGEITGEKVTTVQAIQDLYQGRHASHIFHNVLGQ